MARLMSVAFTEDAVRERRKFVTRRVNWWLDKNGKRLLYEGDRLTLCRKVMGRKPGEPLVRIVGVEAANVSREPLGRIVWEPEYGAREMVLEGFPGLDPAEFIRRYFAPQGIAAGDDVTRIEWRYLDGEAS